MNVCRAVIVDTTLGLYAVIILGMGSANERRHYNVTSSLIAWVHNQERSLMWDSNFVITVAADALIPAWPLVDTVLTII